MKQSEVCICGHTRGQHEQADPALLRRARCTWSSATRAFTCPCNGFLRSFNQSIQPIKPFEG